MFLVVELLRGETFALTTRIVGSFQLPAGSDVGSSYLSTSAVRFSQDDPIATKVHYAFVLNGR